MLNLMLKIATLVILIPFSIIALIVGIFAVAYTIKACITYFKKE